MAGLVPAIHVFLSCGAAASKTWMAATSAGMTPRWWFDLIEIWSNAHHMRYMTARNNP